MEKKKFKVLKIIKTGGDFGGLETDISFDFNGKILYGETYFFSEVWVYSEEELKSYENKRAWGYIIIDPCGPINSAPDQNPEIRLVRGAGRYHFVGQVKAIEENKTLLDFGHDVELYSYRRGFSVGDWISFEGVLLIYGLYFGEISHKSSIPQHGDTKQNIKSLKQLNRIEWANDCTILNIRKMQETNALEILVKCHKAGKPFSLSIDADYSIKIGQKVKITISTNEKTRIIKLSKRYMQPISRPYYSTLTQETEEWCYINKARGVVERVFEDVIQEHNTKHNIVVVKIGGFFGESVGKVLDEIGEVLVESIDTNPEKLKVGDFVRVGISHVGSELFDLAGKTLKGQTSPKR